MDRCAAPAAHGDGDDDELGVFAAERYFYGDDALLWCGCGRSSSSLSVSSAFRTAGTLEHDRSVAPTPTAATTSSEASWNSRSALLPPPAPAAEKVRAGAGAATPVAAEQEGTCDRAGPRRASSSSSSLNLRRWLLGVAGCACGGAGGDGEESVSADEMEAGNGVPGAGGKKCYDDASSLSPRSEIFAEPAFEESAAAAAATARRGSGRWLLEGGKVLVETDAFSFSPIEIAGHAHRRGANSGELSSMPAAVLHPAAAAATADERRRRRPVKSFDFMAFGNDDQGMSALGQPAQNSSAFTIVAGGNAPRAASAGEEDEDDSAARSELGCAYPPSEASVVWSVVTADGAASGNFSSAASGYYYHYFGYGGAGEDGALRQHDMAAAARTDRRRRGGGIATTTAGSLLACMSDKAVDAVGPVGAAAGGRNDHRGGYHDVVRRRVGR